MIPEGYTRKVTMTPVPRELRSAKFRLRYRAKSAEKHLNTETVETLRGSYSNLVLLTRQGFVGTRGLEIDCQTVSPDTLEVRFTAARLPRDFIVIALRALLAANDSSPEDFQRLLYALDHDFDAAREFYGGVDFETEVAAIEIDADLRAGLDCA